MDERSFEVVAHITDPSNTCRGVIRNIPMDHTAETILSSLLDYDRLGLILTGRRMGATTSILVTFRGTRVPFYISYQGGITRCVPYRHKTEACTLCRKLGHRPDVCPGAPQTLCPLCGIPNPLLDHECEPKCVVCDNDHPTGSPQCPQRYKPKPKIWKNSTGIQWTRDSYSDFVQWLNRFSGVLEDADLALAKTVNPKFKLSWMTDAQKVATLRLLEEDCRALEAVFNENAATSDASDVDNIFSVASILPFMLRGATMAQRSRN
ncbi:hypothetical protein MTO96_035426 [Rhipicephalus appendiculatus]